VPCTKELYDAFGKHDEEEGIDKNTGLCASLPGRGGRLRFHKGFLDDEDPNMPQTPSTQVQAQAYHDKPEKVLSEGPPSPSGSGSGSESGSGDRSWEHASQMW
jgi:hypothetical protein